MSPKDIPEAAVILGYERTGWRNESGNTTWEPDSEITDNIMIREVWALVKPIVQVSADKEKGCPSSINGIKIIRLWMVRQEELLQSLRREPIRWR